MDVKGIKDPAFLKMASISELQELASAIRVFLLDNISETGGHLSSNLGVVELTIALHKVFDSPNDKLIF
ncbi:MAG: 1-deoxy-D-xylulose-5-phosphate synthase N-terminal domain-containing protein, partial [bacterium]